MARIPLICGTKAHTVIMLFCSMIMFAGVDQVYSQDREPLKGESALQSLDIPPQQYSLVQLIDRASQIDSFDRGLVSEWQLQRWCWLNDMSVDACAKLFITKVSHRISVPCPEWWAADLMMDWRQSDGQNVSMHPSTSQFGPITHKRSVELGLDPSHEHYVGQEAGNSCILSVHRDVERRKMTLRHMRANKLNCEIDLVDIVPFFGPNINQKLYAEVILEGDHCTIFAQEYLCWIMKIDLKKKAPDILFFDQAAPNDVSMSKTFKEFRLHAARRQRPMRM